MSPSGVSFSSLPLATGSVALSLCKQSEYVQNNHMECILPPRTMTHHDCSSVALSWYSLSAPARAQPSCPARDPQKTNESIILDSSIDLLACCQPNGACVSVPPNTTACILTSSPASQVIHPRRCSDVPACPTNGMSNHSRGLWKRFHASSVSFAGQCSCARSLYVGGCARSPCTRQCAAVRARGSNDAQTVRRRDTRAQLVQ